MPSRGQIVFKEISEGGVILKFNPELRIDYFVIGNSREHEDIPLEVSILWDFGMQSNFQIYKNSRFLGLEKIKTIKGKIERQLIYDLFHAFCHPPEDPNYLPYHWALYGNLKQRAEFL